MRKPVYTRNLRYRIISTPNDVWEFQRLTAATPTKKVDPWESRVANLSQAEALARVAAFNTEEA